MWANSDRKNGASLTLLLIVAAVTGLITTPARGLVFDSTYDQAVKERDEARKQRDEYKQQLVDVLKNGSPAIEKALQESQQARDLAESRLESERQRRLRWQALGVVGIVIGLVLARSSA